VEEEVKDAAGNKIMGLSSGQKPKHFLLFFICNLRVVA
jgi:hypothetical protein